MYTKTLIQGQWFPLSDNHLPKGELAAALNVTEDVPRIMDIYFCLTIDEIRSQLSSNSVIRLFFTSQD